MARREPASIRFKNPGAMWGSALAIKWGAQKKAVALKDGTGQGNNIAVFPTYVQGICAQLDLWRTSKHYKNRRFADAIAVWSGGNHVESYIKFVCDRVPGMTRNTVMNDAFWRSSMGIAFLKAQAWHEAGKRYPAPAADWIEAQNIVFSNVAKPKPKLPPAAPVDQPSTVERVEAQAVQELLRKLNYVEAGIPNGDVGGRTIAAIAAFMHDRGMKGAPEITPALKAELDKAVAEGWVRPIAEERKNATTETLAPQIPEIDAAKKTEDMSFWGGVMAFLTAVVTGIAKFFQDAADMLAPVRDLLYDVPGFVWALGAVGISGALYYQSRRGRKSGVEAFQTGART
jgi:hypothetical protein